MLNKKEIEELIKEKKLVSNYIDLEKQLTPNGFDMTVAQVFEYDGSGRLDFSNNERVIPKTKELFPVKRKPDDKYGWWHLKKGSYKVVTNETVCIPNDIISIAFTRSSLLRMGAFTQNGVWDAGFIGKSEFILIVENPHGMEMKQNARIIQLLFERINEVEEGYKGIFQEII
ncbi:MAG: deoxyuridine 5'-triphosphate nucleotidohydrolase [Candidatus Saganbacteria bacterium]|nr:deoxyuridine 5'-triphosphate nucleotidohydrolase [Candidatus Saganbacteria bacterium]